MLRPEVVDGVQLNAAGFKILLEILVKGHVHRLAEEPIVFRDREVGESKLTRGVMANYVAQLVRLYMYPGSAPLVKFLFIGGVGTVIDIGLFTLLTTLVFGHSNTLVLVAQLISFAAALAWNYYCNANWTFAPSASTSSKLTPAEQQQRAHRALVKYLVLNVASFVFRAVVFRLLKSMLGVQQFPWLQLLLLGVILMATAINYLGSKLWAFSN